MASYSTRKKILVISDQKNRFGELISCPEVELCFSVTMADGQEALLRGDWAVVFVQYHLLGFHQEATLRKLRASTTGRVILLCSILDEYPAKQGLFRRGGKPHFIDDYIIFPQGLSRWIQLFLSPVSSSEEPRSTLPGAEHSLQFLEKLATEDDLTGLKNRRYVRLFLEQILDYAKSDNFYVTLLLFDIDNFKQYNDQYGHSVGDQVLRQVGDVIKHCCRYYDIVARVGGDEFAVVFWDLPSCNPSPETSDERRKLLSEHPCEPLFMAERFRRQLGMAHPPFLGTSGKGKLTISGGLASCPRDGWKAEHLFEKADQAMLEAKRSGKNRIHIIGDVEDKNITRMTEKQCDDGRVPPFWTAEERR